MLRSIAVLFCISLVLGGLGCENSQKRLDQYYGERVGVVKFSGVITVDGQPVGDLKVQLIPMDPDPAAPRIVDLFTDEDGGFQFSTYQAGDGVPPGKYKLLVEQLRNVGGGRRVGPDGLKNLYNSIESPAAEIQVDSPLTNWTIDLQVSDKTTRKAPVNNTGRGGPPKGGPKRGQR